MGHGVSRMGQEATSRENRSSTLVRLKLPATTRVRDFHMLLRTTWADRDRLEGRKRVKWPWDGEPATGSCGCSAGIARWKEAGWLAGGAMPKLGAPCQQLWPAGQEAAVVPDGKAQRYCPRRCHSVDGQCKARLDTALFKFTNTWRKGDAVRELESCDGCHTDPVQILLLPRDRRYRSALVVELVQILVDFFEQLGRKE